MAFHVSDVFVKDFTEDQRDLLYEDQTHLFRTSRYWWHSDTENYWLAKVEMCGFSSRCPSLQSDGLDVKVNSEKLEILRKLMWLQSGTAAESQRTPTQKTAK